MTFIQFCNALGIIIDALPPAGVWKRYPTTDHPRTRNGAVKWLGEVGFAQNHATQTDVSVWRQDSDAPNVDREAINRQVAAFEQKMRDGWARAARRAHEMVAQAKQAEHNYLHIKGFADARGLVLPDGALLIPMRHWRTNVLVGAQVIRWIDDEKRYEKKMIPGMRAKGAVFRIGARHAARTWLVEGFATALSVEAAVGLLRLRDAVMVCFSAGNLTHVASLLTGERVVFADNDESKAGERAAQATGLRYCMAPTVGHDANDFHMAGGIYKVASLMVDAINSEVAQPP